MPTPRFLVLLPTLAPVLMATSLFVAPSTVHGQDVATAEKPALAIGETLPEAATAHAIGTVGEDPRPLSDWQRSEGLLVIFVSNTCPYVTDWADRLPRLAEQAAAQSVGMVVVNSNARKRKTDDSPEAMGAFAEEHLGDLPYLIDEGSALADLLAAERTPEALLFDSRWQLVYRGQIDDHSGPFAEVKEHYLTDALGALFGEGTMPEATAPLGCKILRPRQRRPRPSDSGS